MTNKIDCELIILEVEYWIPGHLYNAVLSFFVCTFEIEHNENFQKKKKNTRGKEQLSYKCSRKNQDYAFFQTSVSFNPRLACLENSRHHLY